MHTRYRRSGCRLYPLGMSIALGPDSGPKAMLIKAEERKMRNKKGFTLIEMLVVIAIISVLVSVIIPTVTAATTKAKAAADAANLRSILGVMNSVLITREQTIEEAAANYNDPGCKTVPGAKMYVLYTTPGVIDVYFIDDAGKYYGLKYLADIADNGSTDLEPIVTIDTTGATWYPVDTVD